MNKNPEVEKKRWQLSTEAVHAGELRPKPDHSLIMPIYQTATFTFADTQDLSDFMAARMWGAQDGRTEYGRYGNPTIAAVEAKIASLEHAEDAILFSSGMAAITSTLLALLKTGDHLIITDDCYRRTRQFCTTFLTRLEIECTVVPAGDFSRLEGAILPSTKLILSETPTNPYLRILDLEQLCELASKYKIRTAIDSTLATPINMRALSFGIDLVFHSATKYLGGHNDLLSGAVVGSESLLAMIRQHHWMFGAISDPNSAYLLHRGLKTLALRVHYQNASAQAIAEFLNDHPKVGRVWYPGLKSHPDHHIASKQMRGFGGVVSFEHEGDLETTSKFVDAVEIPIIAPSLGGVETLIEQPALMSYAELSKEECEEIGIRQNLVRLSLGVEDPRDLIDDLAQALDAC